MGRWCKMDELTRGGAHLFAPSPHKATCVLFLRLMYMIEVEQSECRLSTMLVSTVFSY